MVSDDKFIFVQEMFSPLMLLVVLRSPWKSSRMWPIMCRMGR